jgi:hypothetical protein
MKTDQMQADIVRMIIPQANIDGDEDQSLLAPMNGAAQRDVHQSLDISF